MTSRRLYALCGAVLLTASLQITGAAQAGKAPGKGAQSITPDELQQWLSYIASDELQGRQIYTEGLGLAGAYIADHLKEWGVQPAGDDGTYFQIVKVLGVSVKRNSSVTVTVNGQSKTFKDGEGVTFVPNAGGKQTITANAEFIGYGLSLPEANIDDYKGHDVNGRIAIYVGRGPQSLPASAGFRVLTARARNAIELNHAVAAIGPALAGLGRGGGGGRGAQAAPGGQGAPGAQASPGAQGAQAAGAQGATTADARGGAQPQPQLAGAGRGAASQNLGDFQTVERLDKKIPPQITASDEFFEFVFKAAGQDYSVVKAAAEKQEALPSVALGTVSLTINVDNDYTVVQTRLSHNIVGRIEGSDPKLKDTYVLFGAHYDHTGYQQTPPGQGRGGFGGGGAPGGCTNQQRDTPKPGDVINNGADDDGSGTVAVMALAHAFATGPKPKRSLLFVWHTGEESGLYGSRYMADYPEVPLDKVSAQLNIDMIGRNRCDDPKEENTVYVVGSDRISTELHNLNEDANTTLSQPMKLDYEMNDPADPESIYTRSDHYSYASKGIPIIFYTTGLHRDYHYLTDEVGKIDFPKLAHITSLVYATGTKVANLDHFPARDNKGPRKGKGATGKIGG
jgi:Peptidase family M28